MNRQQYVDDAKSLIGPSCEVTDAVLAEWVNDGRSQIFDDIQDAIPDYYSKRVFTSTIKGQGEYVLPVDFRSMISLKVDGVKYDNQGRFARAEKLNKTYYIRGNVFGFPVAPTKTGTRNIEIVFSYYPEELIGSVEEADIPLNLQRLIKHYVYANYLAQDDEHSSSINRMQIFENKKDEAVDRLSQRTNDLPTHVEEYG